MYTASWPTIAWRAPLSLSPRVRSVSWVRCGGAGMAPELLAAEADNWLEQPGNVFGVAVTSA
jgi:hypothetical protein